MLFPQRGQVLLTIAFMLLVPTQLFADNKNLIIAEFMSEKEFKEAGLHKLSKTELAKLDSWFTKFAVFLYTEATATKDLIESRIDGDFEGWSGDTIFKLENGQIWQQDSYAYRYKYAYRPKVLIYKTSLGRYKMKVDGLSDEIYVKRIFQAFTMAF